MSSLDCLVFIAANHDTNVECSLVRLACSDWFPISFAIDKFFGNLFHWHEAPHIVLLNYSTITVMTSLVALSFYGASQLKFHWVERYDKLLVGSVLCLVGILTLVFHDHDHVGAGGSTGEHLHRKIIVLWRCLSPFNVYVVPRGKSYGWRMLLPYVLTTAVTSLSMCLVSIKNVLFNLFILILIYISQYIFLCSWGQCVLITVLKLGVPPCTVPIDYWPHYPCLVNDFHQQKKVGTKMLQIITNLFILQFQWWRICLLF